MIVLDQPGEGANAQFSAKAKSPADVRCAATEQYNQSSIVPIQNSAEHSTKTHRTDTTQ